MKGKHSPKASGTMLILSIIIVFAALAIGIVAFAKQEYIIGTAMLLVILWQTFNYRKWKKSV